MKLHRTVKLFLAFALATALFGAAGAQTKTDRENAGLRGAVKTISSKQSNFADANAKAAYAVLQRDVVTYDRAGNETERVIYDDYGTLVGKETRTFKAGSLLESVASDPQNKVMEKQAFTYRGANLTQIVTFDGAGAPGLKQVNTYNPKNQLTEESYLVADQLYGKTVFKYDARGNVSETAFFLADGTKATAPIGPCLGAHRVTSAYNEKDQQTVVNAYEADGKLKHTWQYAYNAQGNISEDTRVSPLSKLKYVYTYEYDAAGNWIKQTAIQSELAATASSPPGRKVIVTREIAYY